MGELVEHVEHPVLATIVGVILDEVIGPDMIALLRPQPDARSVGQPEPAVVTTAQDLALRRAMLPERRTGATLGDMQLRSDLLNAGTATRGA